jgi:hypothetical protein
MEHKNTLIAIAASAIISSVCTAVVFTAISDSAIKTNPELRLIDSQLAQIRTELAMEAQARTSLAEQLKQNQTGSIPPVTSATENTATPIIGLAAAEDGSPVLDGDSERQSLQQLRQQRRADRLARQQPGYRQQQLIKSGFAREEAARIVQIEAEESLRQLQAQYDRRRERALSTDSRLASTNPIRSELGEQNYERYLNANGWPTSASVGSVIGGSPGENAGLRAGDNVLSYAGERVFNLDEINQLTIQGQVGESVLIKVERNGEPVQLTIPRGPIGINSGRRFRR